MDGFERPVGTGTGSFKMVKTVPPIVPPLSLPYHSLLLREIADP